MPWRSSAAMASPCANASPTSIGPREARLSLFEQLACVADSVPFTMLVSLVAAVSVHLNKSQDMAFWLAPLRHVMRSWKACRRSSSSRSRQSTTLPDYIGNMSRRYHSCRRSRSLRLIWPNISASRRRVAFRVSVCPSRMGACPSHPRYCCPSRSLALLHRTPEHRHDYNPR